MRIVPEERRAADRRAVERRSNVVQVDFDRRQHQDRRTLEERRGDELAMHRPIAQANLS